MAHAIINAEVPVNAYITVDGYDVAWASPCAATDPSCSIVDLSYQSQFGWEIMSESLFNMLGIDYLDFVVRGGNVDYVTGNNYDEVSGATLTAIGGYAVPGDVAIAVPYFSNNHLHADWQDGARNYWDPISDLSWSEALVVRNSNPNAVPEPGTVMLLALGLFGLAGVTRKKMK